MGPHGDAKSAETPGQALERYALEALVWHWGEAYKIAVTDGLWRAWRLDRIGGVIEAGSPEELRNAILDDYMMKPVPRHDARPKRGTVHPADRTSLPEASCTGCPQVIRLSSMVDGKWEHTGRAALS